MQVEAFPWICKNVFVALSYVRLGKFLLTNMDDHHCSGRFRIPKRALFRASVYLVAILGCALQSNYICQDYFRYPTTTHFSIIDSPPQITPPTLTLSFPYEAKIGTTLKDLFASLKNNVTVRGADIRKVGGKRLLLENRHK